MAKHDVTLRPICDDGTCATCRPHPRGRTRKRTNPAEGSSGKGRSSSSGTDDGRGSGTTTYWIHSPQRRNCFLSRPLQGLFDSGGGSLPIPVEDSTVPPLVSLLVFLPFLVGTRPCFRPMGWDRRGSTTVLPSWQRTSTTARRPRPTRPASTAQCSHGAGTSHHLPSPRTRPTKHPRTSYRVHAVLASPSRRRPSHPRREETLPWSGSVTTSTEWKSTFTTHGAWPCRPRPSFRTLPVRRTRRRDQAKRARGQARGGCEWRRRRPSHLHDVALALLFFAVFSCVSSSLFASFLRETRLLASWAADRTRAFHYTVRGRSSAVDDVPCAWLRFFCACSTSPSRKAW
mmetsp:Transcript_8360/g.52125  ORF Transcript_8360/g.52125 Transcript_8360/m.52125 type:complete len:344 (+) Transcript_8360:3773-4804(+)